MRSEPGLRSDGGKDKDIPKRPVLCACSEKTRTQKEPEVSEGQPCALSPQVSQMVAEASREAASEASPSRHSTHSPSHANSPSRSPAATAAPTTSTSAAASFFARSDASFFFCFYSSHFFCAKGLTADWLVPVAPPMGVRKHCQSITKLLRKDKHATRNIMFL